MFSEIKLPAYASLFSNTLIWKNAIVICIVATLETLLSVEAIDKLDPYNRISPQNRELVAQGTGNFLSGLLGGLPITAVIVRSSANAEAGARTKLSGFFHGIWLLLFVFFAAMLLNLIPYCVLAVILIRTGYNLAKPKMIRSVYKLGREQFIPFIVTVVAILFTDLLIGVGIGVAYAGYFIFKNTYNAGFTLDIKTEGHIKHYYFQLAINVSFINKKKLKDELEKIPDYSAVHIEGEHSVYIDYDVIEVINEFKTKAHHKHIELHLSGIPDVETIEAH
jgi:carbonic anhydrase/SulP family sulfate permease